MVRFSVRLISGCDVTFNMSSGAFVKLFLIHRKRRYFCPRGRQKIVVSGEDDFLAKTAKN